MAFNESPTGVGFSMHMGRIFIEHRYTEAADSLGNRPMTRAYRWVSPDGSQHVFFFDDRSGNSWGDGSIQFDTAKNPTFTNTLTSDNSFTYISGPDDQYCYPSTEHGCYRVKTPDGLVYSLAPRVACPDPPTPIVDQNYARIRAEQQSFCGWYTTLIEDTSVGLRVPFVSGSPDAGPGTTPYPNNIKVTYDSRPGFEHVIATIQDSQGRSINYTACEFDPATNL